ncbi:hypothetical protein LZZ85_20430 [Terrimonas sp. NA20]|uniref:Uncharacterized protein n=1 Tax=Terrimonas ginsenosidimutans TaxID=2908004 RepID=A0ABS9KWE3_9BACT|nr:hypothetical protein [Terrimonas ginsenosidimutans]MCG2616677.1 hypothetical protein [Terrimonas ginsenosidimutans]
MKTNLLFAAILFSSATFAQEAKVKTAQSAGVRSSVNVNDREAINANGSVNSSATIQGGRSTVNATKEAAVETGVKTKARIKQQQAQVSAQTEQTLNATAQRLPKAGISSEGGTSAGISSGQNNKLKTDASLNSATNLSARPVNTNTAISKDVTVRTKRVEVTTNTAVKTATAVKPKPVAIKTQTMSANSTLLKLR